MKPHILIATFYCLIWSSILLANNGSQQPSFKISKDTQATPLSAQELKNLSAFSHLYGYIKYFYPSDEASSINWNKLALLGAKKVRYANSDKELILSLNELFLPIAPELKIYPSSKPYQSDVKINDKNQLKPIYWQHLGHGVSDGTTYVSKRAARPVATPIYGTRKGSIMYRTEANEVSSLPFKVSAYLKQSEHNVSNMWLSVSTEDSTPKFYNSKLVKHSPNKTWQHINIDGTMPNNARTLRFGFWTKGVAPVYIKKIDFQILSDTGNWVPLIDEKVKETSSSLLSLKWVSSNRKLKFELIKNNEKESYSLVIEPKIRSINVDSDLFKEIPSRDEWFTKKIQENITISMPLVVFGNDSTTFPVGKGFNKLYDLTEDQIEMSQRWDNLYVRLSDIIVLWNAMRHFYPYFKETDINWNKLLKTTINKSITNISPLDHQDTILDIMVNMSDGHGQVHSSLSRPFRYLPISLKLINNNIYVEHSGSDQLKAGDQLLLIDQFKAMEQFQKERDKISGSEQHKNNQGLNNLIRQRERSKQHAKLTFTRNDITKHVILDYQQYREHDQSELNTIQLIEDSLYYVDMTRITNNDITSHINDLAKAKGIIFDIRGYPTSSAYNMMQYMLKKNDDSNTWMRTPKILYPENKDVQWELSGWNLKTKKPHIGGKRVFLIDNSAISYAESIVGLITHYNLGKTVGQRTAGANGNVNRIALPSDITVSFTGMKVTKHNGSQLHNIGYKPTIPVTLSISDLRDKRDKVLEKAIQLLNSTVE